MQFDKAIFDNESSITLNGSHFDLMIISWDALKNHLFVEPEMDVIYLSLIKNFKELGWWNDADDCSFQYSLYKNKSKLVIILTSDGSLRHT